MPRSLRRHLGEQGIQLAKALGFVERVGCLPRREHAVEPLPRTAGELRRRRRDVLHFVAFAVAVKDQVRRPAASAADARRPTDPVNAPMDRSSVTNKPSNPMAPRTASPITLGESVPGRSGSSAA